MQDCTPVSPPRVKSRGVRRARPKAPMSKAVWRESFSLLSIPQVPALSSSRHLCPSLGHLLRSCIPVLPRDGAVRATAVSTRHDPWDEQCLVLPRQSCSSGTSTIHVVELSTVPSTDLQNCFVLSDPRTRRRWMLLRGIHSLTYKLAACTACTVGWGVFGNFLNVLGQHGMTSTRPWRKRCAHDHQGGP